MVLILHVFFQGFPAIDFTPYQMALWQPFSGKFAVHVFFVVSDFRSRLVTSEAGLADSRQDLIGLFRLVIPTARCLASVSLMLNAGIIWPANKRPAPYDLALGIRAHAAASLQVRITGRVL